MNMQLIPYFYHPTTLTLVDDDPEFLNALKLALYERFKCHSFISPKNATEFLIASYEKYQATKENYFNIVYEDLSEFSVNVKISKIHTKVFNTERFKKTCLLIVDYDMPEMNGLDLARQLKQKIPTLKIIMLTGEADLETAINAFNSKEIDRFISKSATDYYEKIIDYINQLQQDYFIEASLSLVESLNSQGHHPLQDKDFIDLFNILCLQNHICEYYLLDESGSFLMLDANANKSWLLVRTGEDMQMFYELAADEQNSSQELIESLKKRDKIICFPSNYTQIPPTKYWFMHDAQRLKNKEIYYCLISGKNEILLNSSKLFSYREFLDSD